MALLTIIIASLRDLSASWINCSAPPLNIIVVEVLLGQFLNKLYLKIKIKLRKGGKEKEGIDEGRRGKERKKDDRRRRKEGGGESRRKKG